MSNILKMLRPKKTVKQTLVKAAMSLFDIPKEQAIKIIKQVHK